MALILSISPDVDDGDQRQDHGDDIQAERLVPKVDGGQNGGRESAANHRRRRHEAVIVIVSLVVVLLAALMLVELFQLGERDDFPVLVGVEQIVIAVVFLGVVVLHVDRQTDRYFSAAALFLLPSFAFLGAESRCDGSDRDRPTDHMKPDA